MVFAALPAAASMIGAKTAAAAGGSKLLSALPSILGAGGEFLSGQTEDIPATSGFESLPDDIREWMKKTIFADIQKTYNAPRPTMMMRQYTAEEANDPLTGSSARAYKQDRKNQEVIPALLEKLSNMGAQEAQPEKKAEFDPYLYRSQSFGLAGGLGGYPMGAKR